MATNEDVLHQMGATAADGEKAESGESSEIKKDEYLKGFVFEGITRQGREKLPIEAPSEKVLRQWLEEGHIEVVKIRQIRGKIRRRSQKVKQKELANFVGQLATRKSGGQGDIDAIRSCADATSNYTLRYALNEVAQRMENGLSPDKAYSSSYIYDTKKNKYTDQQTFPREFVHQIRAGKRGGAVALLKDYEARLRRSIAKKKEIISKLIYPGITVGMAIILSQVMVFFVIPGFKPMYEGILGDSQMKLPFLTRMVTGISDFATSPLGVTLLVGGAAVILSFGYWTVKTQKGRVWRQERELFLWGIGTVLTAYWGSVHLTSLGQVMKSTDIVTALKETADGSPHVVYGRIFETMAATIEDNGADFAPSGRPYSYLLHKDFYPLMKTGSKGDMSEQVLKLADQLEEEYQGQIDRLTELITPATVVFLGVSIGVVVIAMYLPMMDIIGRMASK